MSDISLTHDTYKIEPGLACRAEPGSGVGDVPPRPGAAPSPALRVASSVAFAVSHFAETANCPPEAPQPLHRTLAARSSTLAADLNPSFGKAVGVSSAAC